MGSLTSLKPHSFFIVRRVLIGAVVGGAFGYALGSILDHWSSISAFSGKIISRLQYTSEDWISGEWLKLEALIEAEKDELCGEDELSSTPTQSCSVCHGLA
jgi:hypothetical protein